MVPVFPIIVFFFGVCVSAVAYSFCYNNDNL